MITPGPQIPAYLRERYPFDKIPVWDQFVEHFRLNEGFSFSVFLVPDDWAVALLREKTQETFPDWPIHRIVLGADAPDGELAQKVLELDFDKLGQGILWIDADPIPSEQFADRDAAWERNWSRLNRSRNLLMRQWPQPIIVAAPHRLHSILRGATPDFWRLAKFFHLEVNQPEISSELPQFENLRDDQLFDFGLGGDPEQTLAEIESLRHLDGREQLKAHLHARAARQYYQKLQFSNALEQFDLAIQLDEKFGSDAEFSVLLHSMFGQLLNAMGQNVQAEMHLCKSLALASEPSLTSEIQSLPLNNLASLLQDTNRLAEAELLIRRALAIDENSYGDQHPNVGLRLNNLGSLLQETNRLSEAEALMRRALAIFEANCVDQHPYIALILNNLASLLQQTDRLSEAETLMRRALAIDELIFGDHHPTVAVDLNNLSLLLQETNRLSESEPLMRRALAIKERNYGGQHPSVVISINNLAWLLKSTNRFAEAELLMRRALAIGETNFGGEHPKVALRLNSLAQLLHDLNRLTEAELLMRRALRIDEKTYGLEHPTVAIDHNNLASLLITTNRHVEAEPHYKIAISISLRSLGQDHPNTTLFIDNYLHFLTSDLKLTEEQAEARIQELIASAMKKSRELGSRLGMLAGVRLSCGGSGERG
ncbi:MAG: tetratricopeptide repeat protein [Fimbriiglobus sp.]